MPPRRGQPDPFLSSSQARWLLISVVGGPSVKIQALTPGTDLRRAFLEAVDQYRSQGWLIENDPTYPCVFARTQQTRHMLTICQVDPASAPLLHFSPWSSVPPQR